MNVSNVATKDESNGVFSMKSQTKTSKASIHKHLPIYTLPVLNMLSVTEGVNTSMLHLLELTLKLR